ncbi:ghrelin O-acyltransferase [Perognathus longimembris pacificus]|uniref:ghrelin O-acyltransferase n=1 Tax=Perognathus longimembris pacificus TaxID=214514 RepID=UPI002018E57D|nr:ghrelin O-acyltransferase [Perognathus longimembris pacificus]
MDWLPLFIVYPVSLYQGAAFPFALLFRYLCNKDSFSIRARYLFLLAGGVALAAASMGPYALLVLTSALGATVLLSTLGPQDVHRWTFFFQMSWQTLCHLGLHYTEYCLQEPPSARLCLALSSLMLLTQRATSLSMDIRDGKAAAAAPGRAGWRERAWEALPRVSYLLFFPGLLGGPLCSFRRFQAGVAGRGRGLGAPGRLAGRLLGLAGLRAAAGLARRAGPGLRRCERAGCVRALWARAARLRLTYYAQWLLDECVLGAAGFAGPAPDADVRALESAHRIAAFARAWNRSTARWLRRLAFRRRGRLAALRTFAFSAWWHGLHPGQVFGFLCWAVMVEADRAIHASARGLLRARPLRLLHRALAWALAQLILAYVLLAVEGRSLAALGPLCGSCNSLFPALYGALLLLLRLASPPPREPPDDAPARARPLLSQRRAPDPLPKGSLCRLPRGAAVPGVEAKRYVKT